MPYEFEVLDEFEVVFSGKDELLPPRDTPPGWSGWDDVSVALNLAKETCEPPIKKRMYNKVNLDFWSRKFALSQLNATDERGLSSVQYRQIGEEGEAAAKSGGR